MIIWLILALCLAMLSIAAIFSTKVSTALGALAGLMAVLTATWLFAVVALGGIAAHYDAGAWPSAWPLAFIAFAYFVVIAAVAFLRRHN